MFQLKFTIDEYDVMIPSLPCIGAGGGGRTGGRVHFGGPLEDEQGLEKSSSDGLVKELLIWQHRSLICPSPSSGIPRSISSTSKKGIHRGRWREGKEQKRNKGNRGRGRGGLSRTNKQKKGEKYLIHLCMRPKHHEKLRNWSAWGLSCFPLLT